MTVLRLAVIVSLRYAAAQRKGSTNLHNGRGGGEQPRLGASQGTADLL